jgi:hypothetical protein
MEKYEINKYLEKFKSSVSDLQIALNGDLLEKRLKELNLIKGVCESGYDERREKYVIVRGYKPSAKGRETDTYLKQLKSLLEM